MNPFTAAKITGTYSTLLLPLQADDSIDFSRLNDQLDYLVHSGVDGVYTNGTAGEFYTLDDSEFARVNEALASRCEAAGLPFQIGAGFPTPQLSLSRARHAASLQPSAIQVILPDWYPVTNPEAIVYLNRVAEATAPVPLVLYNPPHAKRVLSPEDYEELCLKVPALVGIKVVGGDDHWYRRMSALRERLSIFVPGHNLATGFAHGAAGSYSNVACLQPTGAKRWNDLMRTSPARALEIEKQIQSFMLSYILPFRDRQGASNMALDKLLASAGDWAPVGTRLRWPYAGVSEAEVPRLRVIAREMIPFLFEDVSSVPSV